MKVSEICNFTCNRCNEQIGHQVLGDTLIKMEDEEIILICPTCQEIPNDQVDKVRFKLV